MNTQELEEIGSILYGDVWQEGLARLLGHEDKLQINLWMSGIDPIPECTGNVLVATLVRQQHRINTVIKLIMG